MSGKKEAGVGKIVKCRLEQLPDLWVDVLGQRLTIGNANFAPVRDSDKRYWDGCWESTRFGADFCSTSRRCASRWIRIAPMGSKAR